MEKVLWKISAKDLIHALQVLGKVITGEVDWMWGIGTENRIIAKTTDRIGSVVLAVEWQGNPVTVRMNPPIMEFLRFTLNRLDPVPLLFKYENDGLTISAQRSGGSGWKAEFWASTCDEVSTVKFSELPCEFRLQNEKHLKDVRALCLWDCDDISDYELRRNWNQALIRFRGRVVTVLSSDGIVIVEKTISLNANLPDQDYVMSSEFLKRCLQALPTVNGQINFIGGQWRGIRTRHYHFLQANDEFQHHGFLSVLNAKTRPSDDTGSWIGTVELAQLRDFLSKIVKRGWDSLPLICKCATSNVEFQVHRALGSRYTLDSHALQGDSEVLMTTEIPANVRNSESAVDVAKTMSADVLRKAVAGMEGQRITMTMPREQALIQVNDREGRKAHFMAFNQGGNHV